MSNLLEYAKKELEIAGWYDDNADYGTGEMAACVLKIIDIFSQQGHSGYSASIAINILNKLMRFEPLTPLTGADDEWAVEGIFDGITSQNKRCSHVFKNVVTGEVYDINGIVWILPEEEGGGGVTNYYSRVPVTFPYVPKTEYAPYSDERNLNNKEEEDNKND